jgi:sulfur carrier protein
MFNLTISRMDITVNNESLHLSQPCSVSQLFSDVLQINTTGIAIAINETVVPKSLWESTHIHSGDSIILIKATQGG